MIQTMASLRDKHKRVRGRKPITWPGPPSFVLGIPRSGTTWLANIMDASPDVLFFMEPFSVAYQLIPEFPEPLLFLERCSPELLELLREVLPQRMWQYKSLLTEKSLFQPSWFGVELQLSRVLRRCTRIMPRKLERRVRLFEGLNLNRLDSEFHRPAAKRNPSKNWVIKELRLAGKIPLLIQAFPDARYIVLVRHPCATVHSILSWFDKGRLGEVRRDVDCFLEAMEVQKAGQPYRELIEQCRGRSTAHRVALYWRISFETMWQQLESNQRARFVAYEELAARPHETTRHIYKFLDIPFSAPVEEYLNHSSQRNIDISSPITTVRESARYYRNWVDKISPAVLESTLAVTQDSPLMSMFDPFYET